MRTERAPWTCSWAEYRPGADSAMWLDEWMARWTCRASGTPAGMTGFARCAACGRWQSRDESQPVDEAREASGVGRREWLKDCGAGV